MPLGRNRPASRRETCASCQKNVWTPVSLATSSCLDAEKNPRGATEARTPAQMSQSPKKYVIASVASPMVRVRSTVGQNRDFPNKAKAMDVKVKASTVASTV